MKRIYIAGPYTIGDVAVNVKSAMEVASKLIDLGYMPFCPHLFHFLHMINPQEYNIWMDIDLEYLSLCNALLRIPGDSKGADFEVDFAIKNNIPVYYSISELKKATS